MTGVLGVGLGVTFAAIPGVIVQAIPAGETGFYQVVRFTGSALTATILAAHLSGNGEPTAGGYTVVPWISAGIGVAAALAWLLPARSPSGAPARRRHSPGPSQTTQPTAST